MGLKVTQFLLNFSTSLESSERIGQPWRPCNTPRSLELQHRCLLVCRRIHLPEESQKCGMDELCRTDSLEYVRSLAPPSAAVEKARVCLAGSSEDEGALLSLPCPKFA